MKALVRLQIRELALLRRQLQREIARRDKAEKALKTSKERYADMRAQAQTARDEKERLSRHIFLDHEEERRRISRSLHDEVTQTLAGINMVLATLSRESSVSAASFKKKIAGTQSLVENAVKIVHRFARELRPTLLDDLGLIPALHAFMKALTQRTGLQIRFTAYAGVEKLGNAKRTAFFRVAQSALTNVARHAKANVVHVSLQKCAEGVCLEVRDDGKSFEVEKVLRARRYKRLGLLGMRERVEMFGGTFFIESAPGAGTTVRAVIPFDKGASKHV